MGLYNLDKLFDPATIAVVGASNTEGSIGHILMENLTQGGFEGEIFPVNPKHDQIRGIKAYPSLSQIGRPLDLAIIATPITTVPDLMQECAESGVGTTIIISAGGRETGEEGRELEMQIEKTARDAGIRIIGPNCIGIICPDGKLNASFAAHMPIGGQTAFVSQSGAICTAMLDLSLKENMGFRYFLSLGTMLDVDFGDMIDYLGNDPKVTSILLYIESLTEIRKFMSAARQVSRVKPIVVLKAGKSMAGAKAAASHTGALAGEDLVYDAAFQRAGIARVHTLEDFFDCAELLAKQPLPSGDRLVVLTNAGGPGVMAADAAEEYGLRLNPLSEKTLSKLNDILPPHWSHGNPIDILGDATPKRYSQAAAACFETEEMDGMIVIVNPQAMTNPTKVAQTLGKDFTNKTLPALTAMMGGMDMDEGRDILNQQGVPTYETPERAIRSFAVFHDYARNLELLQEIPSRFPRKHHATMDKDRARQLIYDALNKGKNALSEVESKHLLECYGIPVNPTQAAVSVDAALKLSDQIGYPVVMKILSPDISHKTEAKGVRTSLENPQDIKKAFENIIHDAQAYNPKAEIQGVSLQPMLKNSPVELLIGARKDSQFGPIILFGMGGIFAEVIGDRNIALPPLNRTLAQRVMEKTKVYALLQGYRNIPAARMSDLEHFLVRLSHLLIDFPEITELDMNPVFVKNGKPVAVDAAVGIEKTTKTSPAHLVISPYPEQYESQQTLEDDHILYIRPIKPEDAPILINFFENLSPESQYHRFFGPLKTLPRDMVIRFTQIDYDRHVALVALGDEDREKLLGVARIIIGPDLQNGEFSLVVNDAWQKKGIGKKLLLQCLSAAKDQGVKSVYGEVLAENHKMLNLGRKLGFRVSRNSDAGAYRLDIDL